MQTEKKLDVLSCPKMKYALTNDFLLLGYCPKMTLRITLSDEEVRRFDELCIESKKCYCCKHKNAALMEHDFVEIASVH